MKEYKEKAAYINGKYIGRFECYVEALDEIYKYLNKHSAEYNTTFSIEHRTGRVFDFNERT